MNGYLESRQVGAHPLIEPLIERLRLRESLQQAFSAPDPRVKLAPLDSALVLVRNFTLCRHPLYEVPEWVRGRVPTQLGLEPEQVGLINDDRLGRTLDKLFLADRRTIVTRLIVYMTSRLARVLKASVKPTRRSVSLSTSRRLVIGQRRPTSAFLATAGVMVPVVGPTG